MRDVSRVPGSETDRRERRHASRGGGRKDDARGEGDGRSSRSEASGGTLDQKEARARSGTDCDVRSGATGGRRGSERPSPFGAADRQFPADGAKPEGSLEVARNELYNFRFSGGKELREKLERFAEVIGIENAERHMAEIIEMAVDLALDKQDPRRKLERRRKREEEARSKTRAHEASPEEEHKKEKARAKTRAHEVSPEGEQQMEKSTGGGVDERERARYVSRSEREIQFEDASYQCEYVGPEGVRCTARVGLQIDHIRPVGKGGAKEGNLRVLCRSHNLFCAAREFGEEFMRRKIEGRRTENCSGHHSRIALLTNSVTSGCGLDGVDRNWGTKSVAT